MRRVDGRHHVGVPDGADRFRYHCSSHTTSRLWIGRGRAREPARALPAEHRNRQVIIRVSKVGRRLACFLLCPAVFLSDFGGEVIS